MKQFLNDELIYQTALTKLNLSGSGADVRDIQNLLQLIASVPIGKKLLQQIIMQKQPAKISFVTEFSEQENGVKPKGRFMRDHRSVEVVKIDTTIPEMKAETQLRSKIMMASVLAHELTHFIDLSRNLVLDKAASNINELVLADVLGEMHAYLTGEQVDKELRAHHKLPKIVSCKENEWLEADCFPADMTRKNAMVKALSGQNPKINIYMNKRRRSSAQLKRFLVGHPPSNIFRQNVEEYMQGMGINMPFDEVMICLGESTKLLPCARRQLSGRCK